MSKPRSVRFNWLDRLISGVPYWSYRRQRALKKLDAEYVDDHEAETRYLDLWRRYDFASLFGRTAAPQVMASVKEAADKGVDRDALAILVANKDIAVVDGNQVVLRRVWIARALTIATRTISALLLCYWIALFLSLATWTPTAVAVMVLGILVIAICAYVWEFYSGKPLCARELVDDHMSNGMWLPPPKEPATAQSAVDLPSNVIPLRGAKRSGHSGE